MTLFSAQALVDRLPVYADTGDPFIPGRDAAWVVETPESRPPKCKLNGKHKVRADRVVFVDGRWVAYGTCWGARGVGDRHEVDGEPLSGGR